MPTLTRCEESSEANEAQKSPVVDRGSNRFIVAFLVAMHLLVLLFSWLAQDPSWSPWPWFAPRREELIDWGGLHLPSLFEKGEHWRLLTCAFLHGSWFHLLFNSMGLLSIGRLGESIWGTRNHLMIWFVSAIGAALLSMAVVESSLMIGASGALFGIAVALILALRQGEPSADRALALSRSLSRQIGGWLIAGIAASIWTDLPISAYGHLGGAIAGALVFKSLLGRSNRKLWGVGLGFFLVGLLAAGQGKLRPLKYRSIVGMDAALQEDCALASELLESVVARGTEDPSVLNAWAYCSAVEGRKLEAALVAAKQALALEGEDPNILDSVGWIYCRLGQSEKGREYIRRALALLDEEDPLLVQHLADCDSANQADGAANDSH